MVQPRSTAVFSGAGISGDAPASLPRGFGLRDDVLRLMHSAAANSLPALVSGRQLEDLLGSTRKLEVVLGRLAGILGVLAAECLRSLQLRLPNEAHLLAALHLARGGVHVTLNFDVGIELAHRLLTGQDDDVPAVYREPLARWREHMPGVVPTLLVVAGRGEFDHWVAEGRPPALLKVHGSLSTDQDRLVDVVVLDHDEIGQLTPGRRAAVDLLSTADRLLITGYSGDDPDVYDPLLAAARNAGEASWRCYSLAPVSPVPADTRDYGIELVTGAPDGLATSALRELLGDPVLPPWPEVPVDGPSYRELFDTWAGQLRQETPADRIATAWAWLLADGGDLDMAELMLAELAAKPTAEPNTSIRHAEVLYTRAREDDRDRAAVLYRQVAHDATVPTGTRLLCRLRLADISRGRLVRGRSPDRLRDAFRAYGQPLAVLAATRLGRRDQEPAADAYRALQQTSLRILEGLAQVAPTWTWPALGQLCRPAQLPGWPAERLSQNGNRRGLVRQHRMLLAAYSCLLRRRRPPDGLADDVRSLRNAYRSADDPPGAGNLTVTLAVLAAADGDDPFALELLDEAASYYRGGDSDRSPSTSGHALLASATTLIAARLTSRGRG